MPPSCQHPDCPSEFCLHHLGWTPPQPRRVHPAIVVALALLAAGCWRGYFVLDDDILLVSAIIASVLTLVSALGLQRSAGVGSIAAHYAEAALRLRAELETRPIVQTAAA